MHSMHLDTVLLVLESVLLAFTIVLLVYSIREGKAREGIIDEIGKATKILTRHEYFFQVRDSMIEATDEIVGCITGRMPAGEDIKRADDIVNTIESVSSKGIKIKYLLPKFPDRLHVGNRYSRAGAEVRYSGGLLVNDMRYIVVDDSISVLGLPESVGEKEATKKGYRLPSEGLAHVLRDNFYSCWNAAIPYDEYVRDVVRQTGAPTKHLAKELSLDENEIDRIMNVPE